MVRTMASVSLSTSNEDLSSSTMILCAMSMTRTQLGHTQGAFSHSACTAQAERTHSTNYCVVYPGNTLENHPPTEACTINSKQHRGCRIQDPGTCGKHHTDKKNPWCTSRGCRVQMSRTWDPWLPVMENSRLFVQGAHTHVIHNKQALHKHRVLDSRSPSVMTSRTF